MDGSIERVIESFAARPVAARRERRRREDQTPFQLPMAQSTEPAASTPSPDPDARPVAAPQEGEPGTRLDVRG